MDKNIAGIILAAGQSRRMGTAKMLLPWGSASVIGQVISTFAHAGVSDLVIITGGSRQGVESELARLSQDYPLRTVYNPNYESGEMLSSLQCGLASLDPKVETALVGLGDQPQLSLSAILVVVDRFALAHERIILPSYNLRRGHPWLVHRDFWDQILALKPPLTMRDFFNAHSSEIVYVDTDQTILKDLDTPEVYLREKP